MLFQEFLAEELSATLKTLFEEKVLPNLYIVDIRKIKQPQNKVYLTKSVIRF